jgi:Rhodopirellula transposase DDE domain
VTRGDNRASDHDLGGKEKAIPCGLGDEERAALHIPFGRSYQTRDVIVETIEAKWNALDEQEKAKTSLMQITMDNGPERSGRRTQFLSRMVQFAEVSKRPMHVLYYPPYHSKYNPIARCWGLIEWQWHGAKRLDVETMLGWAKKMTGKGLHPVVALSRHVYTKGIALGTVAMEAVEARLQRDPHLPKDDMVIHPASTF